MKYATVKDIVTTAKKGTYQRLEWKRAAKTKKGCKDTVEKAVAATVRFGINYDNMADTKTGRENGTLPKENAGLPWGTWEQYPYFIAHKKKGETTTTHYLRATVGSRASVKTVWILNGHEVSKSVVEPMLLKSELNEKELTAETPITVKVADITSIK